MTQKIKKLLYDKTGLFKLTFLSSPLFIFGLVAKLYAATFFAGVNFTYLTTPFLKYFALGGGQDPYQFFYQSGILEVFPYPQLMLYILSFFGVLFSPLLNPDIFATTHGDLLLFHLPILAADITILVVLSRWLKNKHTELLWLYWLSPILFYINYLHSQLDAIPIALTFVFLYFLFKEKWLYAFILLGAAITAKFHIVILLPFTLIYLWRRRVSKVFIGLFAAIPIIIFLAINNVQLFSQAFLTIVFANREQGKVFDLQMALGSEHVLYIIPFAYILLFLHALTFTRFNRDTFVMFLGFSFGILTLGIPPMQGWYYWIIPFFIYFYVKNEKFSKLPFVILSIAYFIYFALVPDSDYFSIFSTLLPATASLPNLYSLINQAGFNADLVSNLALSFLQACLFINVLWLYRRGVEESKKQKLYNMPYLIGIAGDSGSGKSTLATHLKNLFGDKQVAFVAGDAMHKWERGDEMWQKFTHLDPRANQLHKDLSNALSLQQGDDIYRRHYDHHTGTFTIPEKLESKTLVIFEGLHSFFLTHMQKSLDLKIFIKPEEQLRTHWKLKRDMLERGYTREKVLSQLKSRERDAEEYITVQEKYADITFSLKSLINLTDNLIGTDFEPAVYLEITCDNTINLEPLLEILATYVNIEHAFTDRHQILSLTGNISKDVIEHLSYFLIPEFYDIITSKPHWESDHSGIMQLFVSYYILESLHYNQQRLLQENATTGDTPLTKIAKAAKEIGSNRAYVQGGGGNVSVKINGNAMAVKASGLRLEELQENSGFVGIDFVSMRRFFNSPRSIVDLLQLTTEYEKTVAASPAKIPNVPETSLRPSIETGFHAILDTAVIHTHSVYANILTCSNEGKQIIQKLFPEAAYIPYHTPGVSLTFAISTALKTRPHDTFFLENHGLIVCGKTVSDAASKHHTVNTTIKKWLKNVPLFPNTSITTRSDGRLVSDHPDLTNFIKNHIDLLATFTETILFPDQVIYCKKFGFVGDNKPITLNKESGVIEYAVSYKEAQAFIETLVAWLYIIDGITYQKLTRQTIPATEGEFIANLESEKYRQKIIA
jgi:uridine kinase/rhamnose utilization protein RhaD (predicted bifunctional aldolase and dehydrogenase)